MRRKIVSVTPKTFANSGFECCTCTRWEGIPKSGNVQQMQQLKAENMRRIIKKWGVCGKLVYVDNEAVAFAQYGPAEFWQGINNFSACHVSEDAIFLACLYVLPYAQGRGLGKVLLQSIEASLIKKRVKAIEVLTTRDDHHPPGPIEFYLQNGFRIEREDPRFPLLRLELKSLASWHANIQFALDGLKIPVKSRASAPASPAI